MKNLKNFLRSMSLIIIPLFSISAFSITANAASISKSYFKTKLSVSSLTKSEKISQQKLASLISSNTKKNTSIQKSNKLPLTSNLMHANDSSSSSSQLASGYAILVDNPSSEVNGNPTTQSKIDIIASANSDGSSSYESENLPKDIGITILPLSITNYTVTKLVDSNNNLIGAQFQFNTPAQYIPMLEVENSSDVWSNPAYPEFNIEPTSGSRPTVNLDHPITSLVPKSLAFNVSWTSSQSQNSSSTLKNSEMLVLNSSSTNDDQIYDKAANSTTDFSNWTQNVSIPDTGAYYVLTSVEDSNGCWSDWNAYQVQIEDSSVQVITPVVSGDEGTVRWNMGLYPSYKSNLSISGTLVDSSGYLLPYVSLNMNVLDGDSTISSNRTTSPTFYTGADGTFKYTMTNLPVSIGRQVQFNYESDDYYDDAVLALVSNNTSLYTTPVYGFAYWIYTGY
ncbi:hypothetical protein [Clostridium akagii]|uniref:hypothetical protein n=1 Tax=Clostridium akagii TaxID=91623 RepID=UPI00047DC3ED|nr:hypothetical protein [Clostridium akagii]